VPVVHPIAAPGRVLLASTYGTVHEAGPSSGSRRAPTASKDAQAYYPVPLPRPLPQRQRRLCLRTHRAAYGTCDQVRKQLKPWDHAADIVTILLPPGMSWHNIEATLLAAAPDTAAKTGPKELAAAAGARP